MAEQRSAACLTAGPASIATPSFPRANDGFSRVSPAGGRLLHYGELAESGASAFLKPLLDQLRINSRKIPKVHSLSAVDWTNFLSAMLREHPAGGIPSVIYSGRSMTRPRPLIKAANGMQIRSHIIEGRFHNLGRMPISHSLRRALTSE